MVVDGELDEIASDELDLGVEHLSRSGYDALQRLKKLRGTPAHRRKEEVFSDDQADAA